MHNPLMPFINWLRMGYPEGVPPADYSPLLAILQRSLTDNEIEQVVTHLRQQAGGDVDAEAVRTSIQEVADVLATPEDVERVSKLLEQAGGPQPGSTAPAQARAQAASDSSDEAQDAATLGFKVHDPDFIADPYPVLAALREAGRCVPYADGGLWLLTHFADVHAALRNRSLGRSFEPRYTATEFGHDGLSELADDFPRFVESERWSLLNLEPPDHTRIRRLVTKVFTAKAVRDFEPRIAQLARDAFDSVRARSEFDVISELAQPFSISVICELLGVPKQHGPDLLRWSHAIVKMYEISTTPAQQQEAEQAAGEFVDFVRNLIDQRRRQPGEDLVSELVQVADDGERLTVEEIVCTVIVLLNAGHEATVNTMGNGLNALLHRPDQWARLVSGEVDPSVAVEEMLRFDPPLQMFERWVLEPVELAGRKFEVGAKIGMLFGAANRDPGRFADADTFDVGRGETTHIGFGGGVHFCIGAPLARAELAALLREIVTSAPALQLVSEPTYHPTFVIRGFDRLGVRILTPPGSRT